MSVNTTRTKNHQGTGQMGGQMGRGPMGGGPMGGRAGGMGGGEKAKDFKGTWGKLIRYCKKYIPVILIALVFAAIGSLLQIIGPDKLGQMTDEIIKGLPSLADGVPILGAIDFNVIFNINICLPIIFKVRYCKVIKINITTW